MTYIAAAAAAIVAAAIALGVEGLFAAYPTVSAVETAVVVAAAAVRFASLPSHYLVYYKEYCIVVAADVAAVLPVDSYVAFAGPDFAEYSVVDAVAIA